MKPLFCLAVAVLVVGFQSGAASSALAQTGSERAASPRPETGFESIFNGRDLTGWDGQPGLWSVEKGAIVGRTSAEAPIKVNTFLIWTNGTVADFELRCDYRVVPLNAEGRANSGIQYRSRVLDPTQRVVGGYQADIEAGTNYTGILYEERMTRGIMALRGEKVVWTPEDRKKVTGSVGTAREIQAGIRQGDWNEYVIIARGNHLQHFVNGRQTVDVTDECEATAAREGVLALQLHVGPPMEVSFKNIRLRRLGP
jgi:hypothetical protein